MLLQPHQPATSNARRLRRAFGVGLAISAAGTPLRSNAQVQTLSPGSYSIAIMHTAGNGEPPRLLLGQFASPGSVREYHLGDVAPFRVYVSPGGGQDFGEAVAVVPDTDGDGRDDVLVGASSETPAGSPGFAGRAYLFSGESGQLIRELRRPTEFFAAHFGRWVAGVRDLDGDGRGDLVIGAWGSVHVFSGGTGLHLHEFVSTQVGDPTRVEVIPDITGDGVEDVATSDIMDPCSETFVGQGRVYLNSLGDLASITTVCNPGGHHSARFGMSIAGVPDVNSDGRADILVGADKDTLPGQPVQCGAAYMISGLDFSVLYRVPSPLAQIGGRFGGSVSRLPDLDFDGAPELLIGAYGHTLVGFPNRSGAAYVYSGRTGAFLRAIGSPTPQDGSFGNGGAFGGLVVGSGVGSGLRAAFAAVNGDNHTHIFAFCRADTDADGRFTPADVARFVRVWVESFTNQTLLGDFDGDGLATPADISSFVSAWFQTVVAGGC